MGSWIWEHHNRQTVDAGEEVRYDPTWVYASPWWEGADEAVAISLCTEDHDDGLLALDIPMARPTGDVKLDAAEYVRVMRNFLSNIRP